MARKSKTASSSRRRPAAPYPSLVEGPAPQERLAHLLGDAASPQAAAMTEEELDRFLEEHRNLWPVEAEIDDFIAWLHKARREGRYD
jgi:hypothetical protein